MEYKLKFISKENLEAHVKSTLLNYTTALQGYNLKKFNSNIIDPVKLTFDKSVYRTSWEEIIKNELYRQKDKTNSNIIGYFHQNLFNYIDGCVVPNAGFDIIYNDNIYVEMKNKHNTMNATSSQKTYMKMQSEIINNPKSKCYLVEIISKKPGNHVWKCKLDGVNFESEKIRRVSIDSFLSEVTGNQNAFHDLCEVLPFIIDEVIESETISGFFSEDTVFEELQNMDPNIKKSLYLLAFEGYIGF
jgi:hypothetical protein